MSNEAMINTILARRSIRKYENKPVEPEKIDMILKAACAAPSANNTRPWHFVEITERKTLDALADVHPYGKMLTQAPLAIVVCGENEKAGSANPWWEQDCSAAMQNILLAATALGLGSVWLGVLHSAVLSEKIRGILGVPKHVQILGIAVLGYGAESKPARDTVERDRVHKNLW